MVTAGVTGIMGAGKTLVSGMFKALGAEVIDADGIARELLIKDARTREKTALAFGRDIFGPGGAIDREKLARRAFRDGMAEKLNDIMHPGVLRRIDEEMRSAERRGTGVLAIDAPLLIETGLNEKVDYVIYVRASRKTAEKRLASAGRDAGEEFAARMKFQLEGEEKEKYADFVVDNNGSVEDAEAQVNKIWERITGGCR